MNIEDWKKVGQTNEVAKAFKQLRSHVRSVLKRERLGLFVFGGAGQGKNHIVFDELASHGFHNVMPITPNKTNDLLSQFHNATYKRKVSLPLVFDEARLIFETEANINILKLALDPSKSAQRWHSDYIWFGEDADGKKERRKGTSLAAPIIAMTNKNLHELDHKVRDHAEALLSRVPPIAIPSDPIPNWQYAVFIGLTTDVLTHVRGRSLSLATRSAIFSWFTDHVHDLSNVSIRTLEAVRDIFARSGDDERETDLELLMKPVAKRSKDKPPPQSDWAALRKGLGN